MKEKDFRIHAGNIRLSAESKERIIRNLETMTQNLDVSQEKEIPQRPIVRHIMTAVAACLVIAVSAGGIYHLAGGKSRFSPGSAVTETVSVSMDEMQKSAPAIFASLAELELYVIPPHDRGEIGKCPETVSYTILSNESQQQLSELYSTLDFQNPVKDYSFSSDWKDRFLLFLQYEGIYYNVQTIRASDGNTYIQLMCVSPGESRGYTLTYQTELDFFDKANALIQNPIGGSEINIEYDKILYDNLDEVLEILFGSRNLATKFATAIVDADTRIGADAMNAYFISRENQNSDTVQYFSMNRDNFLNFWRILNQAVMGRPNLASDLKTEYTISGDPDFVLYLEDRSYMQIWHGGGQSDVIFHNLPGLPEELCIEISEEDYQNLKNALVPEEYFNTEYENINTVLYERIETELMNQMFGGNAPDVNEIIQRAEQTFTSLEEAEYYFSVEDSDYLLENHHEGQYFSIPEEKQKQLAELFRTLNYADMKKNYQNGGYNIVMYLEDANQQKSLVTILFYPDFDRAYLSWHPDGNAVGDNYYLELDLDTLNQIAEILSEPEQLFEKQNPLFNFDNDMFNKKSVPFGDISGAEERLIFNAYAPGYLIPTEEQHKTLTDMFNNWNWSEPLTDYQLSEIQDGESFSIYIRKKDGISEWAFEVRCQLSGYLIYAHESAEEIFYEPELITEIQNLFLNSNPDKVIYYPPENGSVWDEPAERYEIDESAVN